MEPRRHSVHAGQRVAPVRRQQSQGKSAVVWLLRVTLIQELRERVLRGRYRIPFYMSTECEQLLKRFLMISPTKRASLEEIMSDVC